MKSLFIATLAVSGILSPIWAADTLKNQYWVTGIGPNNWFDQDKQHVYDAAGNNLDNDVYRGESSYCWAAAATNILSAWQQQHPDLVQEAKAPSSTSEIWSEFKNAFTNDSGSVSDAVRWYMEGTKPGAPDMKDTAGTGGYYVDAPITLSIAYHDLRMFDNAWATYEYEEKNADAPDAVLAKMSQAICGYLDDGYYISLGVSGEGGYTHAITLWGVETNGERITKMWLADSDDALYDYIGDLGMFQVTCDYDNVALTLGSGEREFVVGYLQSFGIENVEFGADGTSKWYKSPDFLYDMTAIKINAPDYVVPEPATGTLSLLALAGLCARRRRK